MKIAGRTISGGASGGGGIHVLVKPVRNNYYGLFTSGVPSYTYGNTQANQIILAPFIPANTITAQELSVTVANAAASGLIQILVYSDNNGAPSTKLIQSPSISTASSGVKTYSVSYTFTAGTTYWIGIQANQTTNPIVHATNQISPINAANAYSPYVSQVTSSYTFGNAPATITGMMLSTAAPFVVLLKSV